MQSSFTHQGRVVTAAMATSSPPERVWAAWADPDRLADWFTDRTLGRAEAGATVTWIFDRFGARFPYEVLVARPPSHLVLKGSPIGRPPYLLEILIEPDSGGSRLSLVNSGFSVGSEDDEQFEGVSSGWVMALAILKHYLESRFGSPKSPFFAMQPATFQYEWIRDYFTSERGLGQWLTTAGALGGAGEPYALALRDSGGTATGQVLALTRCEVALSWSEIGGVLELKAFRLGPRLRAVCVRGCGWDLGEERAAGIERRMAAAVDRLVEALERRQEP